jgi:hypothetical protein
VASWVYTLASNSIFVRLCDRDLACPSTDHTFSIHLVRDTTGTAIYFMTYESAKQLLANARGNSPTSPGAVVVAGGLCGLVSWACVSSIHSHYDHFAHDICVADISHRLRKEHLPA